MASILDEFKYPFEKAEAQQLHLTMMQLNSSAQLAILAAEKAGLDIFTINRDQAPALVWADILRAASPQGLTRTLTQQTRDRLNPNSPFIAFLDDLLADRPAETEAEPRGADGAPRFLKDTDDISDPEALLYHDDLMIQIGQVPSLITTLQSLVSLAPSVCRLTVAVNNVQQCGTAFRIDSDLLLTNWHVLHNAKDGTQATAVTAEFGYEDDGSGGALSATAIPCDVNTIVTNKDDDWGVIRAKKPLLDTWPVVKLSEAIAPTNSAAAYIIQHPAGERKRLGFVRNQVSSFDDRVVHYLTDTKEGSSGSPVFDAKGKLIALHHAGGRPQEVVGRSPLKKNEGIRISRILDGMNQKQLVVA
jgi:V8-like Glu-specific endopeptidase